ncbi:MAG TPA: hypothetical protein V6C78_33565 [Crinalium sp.]|jgi:hypothetical protein
MDQSQQELRRAAAKAFMESLDQLGKRLASEDEAKGSKTPPARKETPQGLSVQELEDAAKDIEQFINAQPSAAAEPQKEG